VLPGDRNSDQKAQKRPGKKVSRKNIDRILPKVAEKELKKIFERNSSLFSIDKLLEKKKKIIFIFNRPFG
jgi:hypothetical protein